MFVAARKHIPNPGFCWPSMATNELRGLLCALDLLLPGLPVLPIAGTVVCVAPRSWNRTMYMNEKYLVFRAGRAGFQRKRLDESEVCM